MQSKPAFPSYGCFVNVEFEEQRLPWKYWSIVLHYPKSIVKKAGGQKLKVKMRVYKTGSDDPARLANCIIPRTTKAIEMVKDLMMEDVQNVRKVRLGAINNTPENSKGSDPTLSGCVTYRDGFECPEGYCFVEGEDNCENDQGQLALPNIVVEGDQGGGGSGPGPGEPPPGPNTPPPPDGDSGDDTGGGGSPCTTCGPGDTPCETGEGGGGATPVGPDGCPVEQPEPCEGNVVENPRIAPQTYSEIKGARFGPDARTASDGGPLPHWGLDIKNNIGDNIYSMYDGDVFATGNDKHGWGNWMIVISHVDDKDRYFLYAHMKEYKVDTNDEVNAGEVLGIAGESGNLDDAKEQGLAIQHIHIEVRNKVAGKSFNNSPKKNPEDFMTTKFDENGNPIPETDC